MDVIKRLTSEGDVYTLIKLINKHNKPFALDIETTGLSSFKDSLISVAICCHLGMYIIPADVAQNLDQLTAPLVLHNFKFDYTFLYRKGIDLTHLDCRDTMLMHHLIDENLPHSLDSLVKAYYNDDYKEVFWATYKTFQDAPQDAQDKYAALDTYYTLKLYHELCTQLKEEGIPDALVNQVHAFAFTLLGTEIQGVNVDIKKITELGISNRVSCLRHTEAMRKACLSDIEAIEGDLYAKEVSKRKTARGQSNVKRPVFNWGSSQQLQELLYNRLGLPRQFSNDRKQTSDDGALSKLEGLHPVVALIREQRALEKVFNAFLVAALEQQNNGVIYPSFNINGTVTGRISASNPNLQQLPSSGGIRAIYIPRLGFSFISADYKQLEVTLAAHFSMDENLLRVVREGASLHDITAAGVGCERERAKTLNFALQYGAGVGKVQKILGCGESDATKALAAYWRTYPGLKEFIDKCHQAVDTTGRLQNPCGRVRRLVTHEGQDKWEKASVKRQAFNSVIQGTGADITNKAFTQAAQEIQGLGHGRGLFVVHDEIILEVQDEYVQYWNKRLPEIMAQAGRDLGLRVPLAAEASGGCKFWED